MKFTYRCLWAIAYLIPTLIVLGILYIGSYFVVMETAMAANPKTYLPEYPTICRFIESERVPGPITMYITTSHWTNRFYSPLDKIFRQSELKAMEIRRNELIEYRKSL